MKKKLENVDILDLTATGKALARVENQVIFVDKAIPGDKVDILITRKKQNYLEARVLEYKELSKLRIEPKCQHFGVCGGCKWQNIEYSDQLQFKEKQVVDNLERIGKVKIPQINPIIPSESAFYYRNKLEYTFSNMKWLTSEQIKSGEKIDRNGLGFHIPGHYDKIVDIEECHLQVNISNQIRNETRKYALDKNLTFYNVKKHSGLLRNLIVRTTSTGELMVILQVGEPNIDEIIDLLRHLQGRFDEIKSFYYVVNEKKNDDYSDQEMIHFAGEQFIFEQMSSPTGQGELSFQISPKSFYQTNSPQAETLYKLAWEFADLSGNEVIYDLYTGTGTIACYMAERARKVVGIEYVEDAVRDARVNAKLNHLDNTSFYSGDMKDILSDELTSKEGKPDIIITDPPRAGMHKDVCTQLLKLNPRKIIYISCNPATQARDLELLSERYRVTVVQPVDMFPHTPHVENIVVLETAFEKN